MKTEPMPAPDRLPTLNAAYRELYDAGLVALDEPPDPAAPDTPGFRRYVRIPYPVAANRAVRTGDGVSDNARRLLTLLLEAELTPTHPDLAATLREFATRQMRGIRFAHPKALR